MRVVVDIETNLKHDSIHVVVTKDIDTGEIKKWKEASLFRDFIRDATLIIGHNLISFDGPILNRLWNTKIGLKKVFDTLIVSRLLDPSREQGHSLEAWGNTLKFQKINYKATWQWLQGRREEYDGECFDKPIDSLMEHYCSRDVEVCAKLYLKLCNGINEKQFSQDSVELEHKVAAIIAEQERSGFKLDVPYAISLVTTLKDRMAEVLERAQQLYPPQTIERYSEKTGKRLKDSTVVFNMGSRQQVAQKLIELGWNPKKHTEKGSIIIDEAILDEIIKECS